MGQSLKVVIALVFIAALGWVLLQPVFDAVQTDPLDTPGSGASSPLAEQRPGPARSPRSTPSEQPTGISEELRTEPLAADYPARCLEPAPDVGSAIAVHVGGSILFGSPSGPSGGRSIDGTGPVGLSSDGASYALRIEGGVLVAPTGEPPVLSIAEGPGPPPDRDLARSTHFRMVAWSPARCGVGVTGNGRVGVVPRGAVLIERGVASAAYSPDGSKLAVVRREEEATSLWVAHLKDGLLREVYRDPPQRSIDIAAWGPDGRTIYLVLGEQQGLSFVTLDEPPLGGRVSIDPVEQLSQCGDRLLGILNAAIVEVTQRGPRFLTDSQGDYRHLSCSGDGSYIAAIGRRGLVLLGSEGSFLRDLSVDAGYTDVYVDWGSGGAGLVFGRVRDGGDPKAAELWFVPEGGIPRPTGITYRHGPDAVDWAASPPTGLP